MLSAEELLAGSELTYEVEIPPEVLNPDREAVPGDKVLSVRLRPLTVSDLQRLVRAAKEEDHMMATLMVHQSMVEPKMTIAQVRSMRVGLLHFLLDKVNGLSGVTATSYELATLSDSPLARAAHILAREYGWTPEQVNQLTLGQVLLHLQMLKEGKSS